MALFKEKISTLLKHQAPEFVLNDHPRFLEFVKYMWHEFIEGEHHKIMAEKFNRVASGDFKRLIINMATRHT